MKTIAFYSYKGGVGKSMAAANFAQCLSQLGINCAIADLDFEAPSIHTKFPSTLSALGSQGILDCLTQPVSLSPNSSPDAQIASQHWGFSAASISPMKKVRVSSFALKTDELPTASKHEKTGCIHLLTAGNVFSQTYWHRLHSPASWAVTSLLFDIGEHVSPDAAATILGHLHSIKTEIAKLTPEPEILLLDLRSGALPVSYTFIQTWADILVVFFSDSLVHTQHLEVFLPLLRRRINVENQGQTARNSWRYDNGKSGDQKITTIPVLSRILTVNPAVYKDRFPNIKGACEARELFVLPAEPEVQNNEECLFPTDRPTVNCPLTHQYLDLFAELIDPEHLRGCDKSETQDGRLEYLKIKFLRGHEAPVPRIFNLHNSIGALINPADKSRNVSFKVETFQRLLSAIGDNIGDDSLANGLREGGRACGRNFGEALMKMWKDDPRGAGRVLGTDAIIKGQQARVEEWCRFDSDVGFGRFEVDSLDMKESKITSCRIRLIESFLTPDRDNRKFHLKPGDVRLAQLILGYIQGVLELILEADGRVSVSHERMTFDSGESLSQTSIYRVRVNAKAMLIASKAASRVKQIKHHSR